MPKALVSYTLVALMAALTSSYGTYALLTRDVSISYFGAALAQTPAVTGSRQTELFKTTMADVLGRNVAMRVTERDAGNSSGPHRHPGSHTFGYVLEGVYEVKINDGPLQRLGPGGVFYEPPNALHAVSRNGSSTDKVKYLVFSVSDPAKPQTVQE